MGVILPGDFKVVHIKRYFALNVFVLTRFHCNWLFITCHSFTKVFLYPDIDECALSMHNCAESANCTNTAGNFYCTCKEGYFGDGYYCAGIIIIVLLLEDIRITHP